MSWARCTFGVCLDSTCDHVAFKRLNLWCCVWFSSGSQVYGPWWNLTYHRDASQKWKKNKFEPRKRWKKTCHLSINLQWCLGTKGQLQLNGPLNGQLSACGHLGWGGEISSTLQPCAWEFQHIIALLLAWDHGESPVGADICYVLNGLPSKMSMITA